MTNLLSARIENFKIIGLVELKFDPRGGVFSIMGENGAGKSSIIDAVEVALAGKAGPKFTEPIKAGETKSRIVLEFDDLIVTRQFTAKGTSIDVKTKDGLKHTDSTAVLNKLYSRTAIDPFAFSQLDEKKQVDTLLKIIGYDPTGDDEKIRALTQERLLKGRERDQLSGKLGAYQLPPAAEGEQLSVTKLTAQLEEANQHNGTLEAFQTAINQLDGLIAADEEKIALYQQTIAELEAKNAKRREQRAANAKTIEGQEPVDTKPILDQLASADKFAADNALRAKYEETAAEVNQAIADYEALTEQIKAVVETKRKSIAATPMPVPGLTINPETNVLELDGTPFSQASSGIQIRTGFMIALALQPELKLMTIRDGSLLDKSNNAIINELAKEHEMLVIMETVNESQPAGVRLVEGAVVETRES